MLPWLLHVALAGPLPPVVGGEDAGANAWLDAAAVLGSDGQVVCSGVLVAPKVVITAAHCTGNTLAEVALGAQDLDTAQRVAVADVIVHPDDVSTYDIAALILEDRAMPTPRVLARGCVLDELENGAEVTIAGWGATDEWGEDFPTHLQVGDTEVIDDDCSDIGAGCNDAVSPGGELLAGGDGIDSCAGDSGGPLYLRTGNGDFLVGITSRGIEGSSACGEGGIYVRADAIAEWIEDETDAELAEALCGENTPPEPTVEDDLLLVAPGEWASTQIDPGDPDDGDVHSYLLVVPPAHGIVMLESNGIASYGATPGKRGEDHFRVRVMDMRGDWAELRIDVDVRRKYRQGGSCGCDEGAIGPVLALFPGLLALWRRRRRV